MAQKTRSDYSMLNIASGMVGYVLNLTMGILCRMVFTRTLAADYLGVNGLFTNILSMLSLAELGIGSAIGYALYKPLATDDRPKVASLMKFYARCYQIIGVVIMVLGLCLIPFLPLLIQEPPAIQEDLRLLYILFLFNSASSYFFSYRGALLTAAQQNYLVVGISYIVMIAQSIIQMVLLVLTHNYILYLLVLIIGGLTYNVVISHVAKVKFPYIVDRDIAPLEREERKSLVVNVRALTIWKLSGLLVNQTDNLIITYFSGLITVGLASNYTLLSGNLNSLMNIIFSGVSASVGNHNALESTEQKYSLFKAINLANYWMFAWVSIGIFVCSTDMVKVLFGPEYGLPIEIPFVIALNFYMVGMQNAVWTYKNTMGLFRQGRYLLIVTAAINLVVSIWLGKLWGLFGILLATAIARAFTNTWYDPYAIHKYGFGLSVWPYFGRYLAFAVLTVATGAACYFLCALLPFGLLVNAVLKVILCSVICNAVFLLVFCRTAEFKQLMGFVQKVFGKVGRLVCKVLRR